jgi:hypothetical protein
MDGTEGSGSESQRPRQVTQGLPAGPGGGSARRFRIPDHQDLTELRGAVVVLQTATDMGRRTAEVLSNSEIASRLYLGKRTVKWHIRKILHVLGSQTERRRWRDICRCRYREEDPGSN